MELIVGVRHDSWMMALLFILFLLVVGPLAVYAGADSRIDEVARRKRLGSG